MSARHRRTTVISVAALGFAIAVSCTGVSSTPRLADQNLELIRKFTTAWLAERNLDLAKSYLAASFFVLEGSQGEKNSESPGPESATEALEFATLCSTGCNSGEGCFFNLDASSTSVWARERLQVGGTEVAADSRLARLLGDEIEVFSSRLLGCAYVVSLGVQSGPQHSPGGPRIAFLYLVAP